VIYAGNGDSDICPAKHAHQVFARGELLDYCQQNNLDCQAFTDLNDIVKALHVL